MRIQELQGAINELYFLKEQIVEKLDSMNDIIKEIVNK